MTTTPSSNWLALQKSLGRHAHPRKRRKIDPAASFSDTASSFPRDTSPAPHSQSDTVNQHVDLDTTEMKNGESIAMLRKMVLGKVAYNASQTTPGRYLALDCEMVGIGIGGSESSLARVSVVNYTGAVVLDVFVRQREKVVDYRTQWSGIRSTDLVGSAKPFVEVQKTVADLIKDRMLIGHAVYNDLKALLLSHPSPQLRDTQSLAYKHRVVKSRHPALRVLVKQELGIVIQGGEHSSVTDARATMALFRLYKKQWESGLRPHHPLSERKSRDKARANGSTDVIQSSSFSGPSPGLDEKRKRSESSAFDDTTPEGPSTPPPSSNLPSHDPRGQSPTLHISIQSRQKSKPRPPADSGKRTGISSGISTVTKRTGGVKEVRNGKRIENSNGDVGKGSRSGKSSKQTGEKWWKSLGGGKKGTVKL